MKSIFFAILLISFVLLSGCKKENSESFSETFVSYYADCSFQPTSAINLPFNVWDSTISEHKSVPSPDFNFNINNLSEVKLKQFTLTTYTQPDLSFIKSIDVYINANGLDETRIAWIANIVDSNFNKQKDFFLTERDIKEYCKKDNFYLRFNIVTDKVTTIYTSLDANIRLKAIVEE